MPILLPEGVRVPATGDAYNLTEDLRLMMESASLIVPVANEAARTALVSALAAAGRPVSTARPLIVNRDDARDGFELEMSTDGNTWRSVNQVSRDLTNKVLIQAASYVGTTAANGTMNIAYQIPFTTIVQSLVVGAGASASGLAQVRVTDFNGNLNGQQVQCLSTAGVPLASVQVRVNYIAAGY